MTTSILHSRSPSVPSTCQLFLRSFAEHRPANLSPDRDEVVVREQRDWNGECLFLSYQWDCRAIQYVAATLRLQIFPGRGQIWLGSLEVHPHHRRRGVGSSIVRAVEKAGVAAELDRIRLFTRRTASRFWGHIGYRQEADRRYFFKNLHHQLS